jgi:hypothetical protein
MRWFFVVLTATLMTVGAAGAAPLAVVVVTDSTLTPSRVAIDANGSVKWMSRGLKKHTLASRDGSFATFALGAGASRTVHFTRNGRHPYTVDGKRCGVVFVGVPLGAGCTAGGSSGGGSSGKPPRTGTRVYRYNVQADGYILNDGFVNDADGRQAQKWTRKYTWRATFQNVRIKVVSVGNVFVATLATGAAPFRGQARVVEEWDYFYHPHKLFPPDADCDGNTVATRPANLIAGASSPPSAGFFAWVQLPNGWDATSTIQADCNTWSPPTTQVDDGGNGFAGPNGTKVQPFVETLAIHFDRRGGPALRAPASALVRGTKFTLSTGPHLSEETTCSGACSGTLKIEERYKITFTPRR